MAAVADTNKLLSQLPPDTAESVLSWLSSRGKDLPVHIPVKTIRFARECFQVGCSICGYSSVVQMREEMGREVC